MMRRRTRALEQLNAVREHAGASRLRQFCKGTPRMVRDCGIAESLKDIAPGIKVFADHITVHRRWCKPLESAWGVQAKALGKRRVSLPLPQDLQKFVKDFDAELYPDLIDHGMELVSA